MFTTPSSLFSADQVPVLVGRGERANCWVGGVSACMFPVASLQSMSGAQDVPPWPSCE
jgi:hypothetical protein